MIILPTGGTHRTKRAEDKWRALVEAIEKDPNFIPAGSKKKLEVGRGKILELADRIQSIQSESLWQDKLFKDPVSWNRLLNNALENWAAIDNNKAAKQKLLELKPGNIDAFAAFVEKTLAKMPHAATTPKTIQNFLKKQAWIETLTQVREKWKYLEPYKDDMDRIGPDNIEQLTTFVLAKGSVISQAALSLIEPLVGDKLDRVFEGKDAPTAKEVRDYVRSLYGKPLQEILDRINDDMAKSGQGKDLSVEEVQRIKELVSKVGSLEFGILANKEDDSAAIEDAKKQINSVKIGEEARGADPGMAGELKEDAEKGLPPPGPRDLATNEPKIYTIKTARGTPSRVTYRWVELGTTERKQLNLDNAARTDTTRNVAWHKAATERNRATELPFGYNTAEKDILQGALFFSRKCEDRNLPEDERRKKEFEYFVLIRDPEFRTDEPSKRTPKIDGSYLVNAYGGAGLRSAPNRPFHLRHRRRRAVWQHHAQTRLRGQDRPRRDATPPPPRHHPRRPGDVRPDHPIRDSHPGNHQRQLHAEGSRFTGQRSPRRPSPRHAEAATGQREHHRRHAR